MSRQRAVRQQLEDLRRAGITHISKEAATELTTAAAALVPAVKPKPPTTVQTPITQKAATPTPVSSATAPQIQQRNFPTAQSTAARSTAKPPSRPNPAPVVVTTPAPTAPVPNGCTLSRDERIAQLQSLAQRVAQCVRCQELARTRKQTVFGVGNPEASIMFIGEAPGADEDAQGEPFVGAAGQLLNKIITASKLTREEVYICNILRCRPPGNRNPAPAEAANCREFLDGQIATINPQWIVCLGSVAAQNLLNTKSPIGKLRGLFHDYKGIKVLCTYHPSYLLRYESAKKELWADMKFFRAAQGVVL